MQRTWVAKACWAWLVLAGCLACGPEPAQVTSTATLARPVPSLSLSAGPTRVQSPTASATVPDRIALGAPIELRHLPGAGHAPQALAVLGDRVYVANRATNNVSVLEQGRVTAVVPVGRSPCAVAADSSTGMVYVANEEDGTISFLSEAQVVRAVPGPHTPTCLVAVEGRLYVGGRSDAALWVLDGLTGERSALIPLNGKVGTLTLAVNPSAGLLYASLYDALAVVDLDRLELAATWERPIYVTLAVDEGLNRVLVGEYDPTTTTTYLVAYDARGEKELGRVALGTDPRGAAVDPVLERIYVTNSWDNTLSIIDSRTLTVITELRTGLRPVAVVAGSDQIIHVLNAESENVARLDGRTLTMSTPVALSILPSALAVDPSSGRLFVACASTNSVFEVENGAVVAERPVGQHPTDLAFGADGQSLFVLNRVSQNVSVVDVATGEVRAEMTAGDLPQGLAVSSSAGQLYAGSLVLEPGTGGLLRRTRLLGYFGAEVQPIAIHIDEGAERAFVVASNGVPGSNGGLVVYVINLLTGEQLPGWVGGLSTTAVVLDSPGQRVYSTAGRFGRFQLIVNDSVSLEKTDVVDLPGYPTALAFNPVTSHLFIAFAGYPDATEERQGALWVYDVRSWGLVAQVPLPEAKSWPYDRYKLALDARRGVVYLADLPSGLVFPVRDVGLPLPPRPTATESPTPWPTLTPEQPAVSRIHVTSDEAGGCPDAKAMRF